MFFKLILTCKWKLAQKFSNFLLNKINFDTALNFNQVDLPYPVWNRVNLCQFQSNYCLTQAVRPEGLCPGEEFMGAACPSFSSLFSLIFQDHCSGTKLHMLIQTVIILGLKVLAGLFNPDFGVQTSGFGVK
jgi:hypothetical protein